MITVKGIITRMISYKNKDGKDKVIANVLSVETGQTETMFLDQAVADEKGLKEKIMTQEELVQLGEDFQTIDFVPSSKMASIS